MYELVNLELHAGEASPYIGTLSGGLLYIPCSGVCCHGSKEPTCYGVCGKIQMTNVQRRHRGVEGGRLEARQKTSPSTSLWCGTSRPPDQLRPGGQVTL